MPAECICELRKCYLRTNIPKFWLTYWSHFTYTPALEISSWSTVALIRERWLCAHISRCAVYLFFLSALSLQFSYDNSGQLLAFWSSLLSMICGHQKSVGLKISCILSLVFHEHSFKIYECLLALLSGQDNLGRYFYIKQHLD